MSQVRRLIEEVYARELPHDLLTGLSAPEAAPGHGPDQSAWGIIAVRMHSIAYSVVHTCMRNQVEIGAAVQQIATWMEKREIVRFLGAGRALLAAAMPANRMAHGGAHISFMGGMVPLPNSISGGGVVACSASGRTRAVLDAMDIAKKNNPSITILGLASHDAADFKKLSDIFIGIHAPKSEYPNPLSALADTEEYAIAEVLDGLVVMAGKTLGFDDEAWRKGHEDIGPTGPYAPRTLLSAERRTD